VRGTAHVLAIAGLFVFCFAAFAEWAFWGEFSARFNFIAVDYLVYTREVLANIPSPYPVLPIAAFGSRPRSRSGARAVRPADRALRRDPKQTNDARVAAVPRRRARLLLAHPERPRASTRTASPTSWRRTGSTRLFSAFRHNELDYAPFYVTAIRPTLARSARALAYPNTTFADGDPSA
jgi:hypothetical protein